MYWIRDATLIKKGSSDLILIYVFYWWYNI